MTTQPTDGVWTELASDQHLQLQLDALKPQITDDAAVPTMAVKANIGVEGLARSAGSKVLEADRPVVDAPVVAALKTAGYVVAGTTNMHELAFGISSENADDADLAAGTPNTFCGRLLRWQLRCGGRRVGRYCAGY